MNQQLDIDLYHYLIWVYAVEQTWSKAPLSHFYGPCPVAPNGYAPHEEEELLSPASVVAFVFVFLWFSIATYKQDLQCHIFIMSSVCH